MKKAVVAALPVIATAGSSNTWPAAAYAKAKAMVAQVRMNE